MWHLFAPYFSLLICSSSILPSGLGRAWGEGGGALNVALSGYLHIILSVDYLLPVNIHSWLRTYTRIEQMIAFVSQWTLRASWGLTICLWLGPPWFNYWFSFTLAFSRISHEYSSLFIIVINLIFMFSLWCMDWVGSLYANRFFLYFCIKSSIGTQGEVG